MPICDPSGAVASPTARTVVASSNALRRVAAPRPDLVNRVHADDFVPFQRNEEILERIFAMWLDTFELDPRRRARLAAFLRVDDGPGEDLAAPRPRAEQLLQAQRYRDLWHLVIVLKRLASLTETAA